MRQHYRLVSGRPYHRVTVPSSYGGQHGVERPRLSRPLSRHYYPGSRLQLPFKFCTRENRAPSTQVTFYRSIWLSDFHLGTHACQAEILLDFLRHHQAQQLYLVGDIVDGWNLGPSWNFSEAQRAVVAEIAAWRRGGTFVEFLPGNHDESNLDLVETLLGLVPLRAELIHRTADGRRMLVAHGHQFDRAVTSGQWLKGRQAYSTVLRFYQWYAHEWAHRCRRPRSLSGYLRHRIKRMIEYLTDFDDRAVFETVRRERADGLICGHVHRAEQRLIGPIWYINDGDWVENCTALVEDHSGALRLVRWTASPAESDGTDGNMNEERPRARLA